MIHQLTLPDLTTYYKSPDLEGVLVVDKPLGITSHDVVDQVRRLSGIKRVGHAGTLDPLASGVLIILVGRNYTKRQAEFMHQEKEYVVTAELGKISPSYDLGTETEVTAPWSKLAPITEDSVETALEQFRGEILQTAPAYSAIKKQGRKLYELARAGEISFSDLPARNVTVSELRLHDFTANEATQSVTFSLTVVCSSGTYVRSLVHDLGQALTVGAVVTQLRRTRSGSFRVEDAAKIA